MGVAHAEAVHDEEDHAGHQRDDDADPEDQHLRGVEHEADAALLARLALFAARRWTPLAAISDAQGLWLDLTGVAHLFGGEARMCARILRFLERLGLASLGELPDLAPFLPENVDDVADGEDGLRAGEPA